MTLEKQLLLKARKLVGGKAWCKNTALQRIVNLKRYLPLLKAKKVKVQKPKVKKSVDNNPPQGNASLQPDKPLQENSATKPVVDLEKMLSEMKAKKSVDGKPWYDCPALQPVVKVSTNIY